MKPAKTGRPRRTKGLATRLVSVRMTDAEYRAIVKAAHSTPIGSWMRTVALTAIAWPTIVGSK